MNMKMGEFHFKKILPKLLKNKKSWLIEKELLKNFKNFLSIDEAGRGALAGPLSVAGLFLDKTSLKILSQKKIKFEDSKDLKEKEREEKFELLKKLGVPYKKVFISSKIIDKIGIQKAFVLGIKKIKKFFGSEIVVSDGLKIELENVINIKQGGKILNSLGGASIIAKVTRDNYMKRISKKFSLFKFDINKGYGTKEHLLMIKKFGITPIHRKSYLKNFFKEDKEAKPFV